MQIEEERLKAVEKILREPVAAHFSDQAWKIRTNLIIASSIALVMGLADLRITPASTFIGLQFEGLNNIVIRFTLAAVVVYLLVHFLWASLDTFLEWRLRITGTRSAFQTGSFFTSEHADYPDDPRQSTLYNWWSRHRAPMITNVGALMDDLKAKMKEWEKDIQAIREGKNDPYSHNLNHVIGGISQVNNQLAELGRKVEATKETITDDRIPTSLRRFDRWFQIFLRSENLRWLVIEFGAPVAFSFVALYQLLK